MAALLVRNARLLMTMDEQRRETEGGGLFVHDNSGHVTHTLAWPLFSPTVGCLAL